MPVTPPAVSDWLHPNSSKQQIFTVTVKKFLFFKSCWWNTELSLSCDGGLLLYMCSIDPSNKERMDQCK